MPSRLGFKSSLLKRRYKPAKNTQWGKKKEIRLPAQRGRAVKKIGTAHLGTPSKGKGAERSICRRRPDEGKKRRVRKTRARRKKGTRGEPLRRGGGRDGFKKVRGKEDQMERKTEF